MSDEVFFRTERSLITYVVRILEGYEYLGVVTTVDSAAGIARVRSTADTAPAVRKVLASLSIPLEILPNQEIVKKG